MSERRVTGREAVLELRLEVGSQPITGTLTGAPGGTVVFHGWIELARLLDEAHRLEPPENEYPA